MPPRRIGLIARLTLPSALSALADAAVWLEARGAVPVVDEDSARAAALTRWTTAPRPRLPAEVDLVVAFGGDGTLLDAAGAVAQSGVDVPVLGINLGHLGFLTEVGRTDLTDALQAVVEGRMLRTEPRLLLDGRIVRGAAGADVRRLALNDIVVTRGAVSRMIELDVTVDGHFVTHVKADGLIVATATGSTAYNLSAGGPILLPGVDALVLTPIAPHTLTNRPLVLPASVEIMIRPVAHEGEPDIVVTFDGQQSATIGRDDAVHIARAPQALRLARLTTRSHFEVLREKLKWG